MADDWKYAVEDFDDPDEDSMDEGNSTDGQATDVFGERSAAEVEPGSPTLENTLFVLLGVGLALFVILGV
jgi:hypothetical protein